MEIYQFHNPLGHRISSHTFRLTSKLVFIFSKLRIYSRLSAKIFRDRQSLFSQVIVELRRKINTKSMCVRNRQKIETYIQSPRNSKSDWFYRFDTSYILALQTLNTHL